MINYVTTFFCIFAFDFRKKREFLRILRDKNLKTT